MKTCNDRKEEREGGAGKREREREQALEGCVCLCQGETMANVVVNLFCAKFKNIFTPGPVPAPFDAVLPTATLAPPSHSLHAHCQPWTMTQTMIFTFFICLRKVFLPFFAPLLLFYSPPLFASLSPHLLPFLPA